MVAVLKKCIECGREFVTVFDKECEQCQMEHPKVWSLEKPNS